MGYSNIENLLRTEGETAWNTQTLAKKPVVKIVFLPIVSLISYLISLFFAFKGIYNTAYCIRRCCLGFTCY